MGSWYSLHKVIPIASQQVHSNLTAHAQACRTRQRREQINKTQQGNNNTRDKTKHISVENKHLSLSVLNWLLLPASGTVSGQIALWTTSMERSAQRSDRYPLGSQFQCDSLMSGHSKCKYRKNIAQRYFRADALHRVDTSLGEISGKRQKGTHQRAEFHADIFLCPLVLWPCLY